MFPAPRSLYQGEQEEKAIENSVVSIFSARYPHCQSDGTRERFQ